MKPDYKLVAKAKYIHTTADLASELWHEVYKRYYPAKQLDTLVEELQSADAIEADIDNDVNYFLVFLGGKLIGEMPEKDTWSSAFPVSDPFGNIYTLWKVPPTRTWTDPESGYEGMSEEHIDKLSLFWSPKSF